MTSAEPVPAAPIDAAPIHSAPIHSAPAPQQLVVDIQRRFSTGFSVQAAWQQPSDQFSITVLLGPSGCGKTTVLRCLAGLDRLQAGSIHCGPQVWCDVNRAIHTPPNQRQIGYLFQEYALFPHLTVSQNVQYGLRRLPRAERQTTTTQLLRAFDIWDLRQRYPSQISGGQQQRVALARTVAIKPRILLLDEPLTALDPALREQMRRELRTLLEQFSIPTILVTHDRLEAMTLADRVIVMSQGEVRQIGSVPTVFSHPADLNVAQLVGVETVHEAKIVSITDGVARVQIQDVLVSAVCRESTGPEGFACIRGEDVILERQPATGTSLRNHLPACVIAIQSEGPLMRVALDCGFPLTALITRSAASELELAVGQQLFAGLKSSAIHWIPRVLGAQEKTVTGR
ncbi:MAG: ABC transporter ATP-binding protein [Planctomycetota bacterium]